LVKLLGRGEQRERKCRGKKRKEMEFKFLFIKTHQVLPYQLLSKALLVRRHGNTTIKYYKYSC
jgi:hypothetical protein